MRKAMSLSGVFIAVVLTAAGCSKKQILPGALTGGGAAMFGSGVIYRASLGDADSLFGDTSTQKAVIATLVLTGTALLVTGVIIASTTPLCETNGDCWTGDACEIKTKTCVPKPLNPLITGGSQTAFFLDASLRNPVDLTVSTRQEPGK